MFSRTKDLTGQKFGKLTPLYPTGHQARKTIWRCRCECGKEVDVRGSNLTQRVGPTTSCKCAMGFEDLTNQTFGKWSVIFRRGNDKTGNARWECRCQCGTIGLVSSNALRKRESKSCGCSLTTHGMSHAPEYRTWYRMIQRCYNPNTIGFAYWGGRGITVCDEWRLSFEAFFSHIGAKPKENLSLDRIDNDGNYEPGNVRWATAQQQRDNQRKRVSINTTQNTPHSQS